MANLAKLVVNLEAQTANYQRKLDAANRKLSGFAKKQKSQLALISKGWGQLKTVVAGYLGLRTARAFASLVSGAAEAADSLAKQADILGIATEKLAAYQLGARIAGSDNNALEKGMRRLQKAISDGADGLSTYTRAFGKLKLDPAELKRLTPDQQFEKLAEAFTHLETQTDKVSVAYDIFGGRNVALLKLLDEVGSNMRGLEEDTKRWGIALNRTDAAKIEEARDQIERAKTAVQGLATQFALKLAPAITEIADRFADAASSSDGFFASIGAAIAAGTSNLSKRREEILKDIKLYQKLLDIQKKLTFGFGQEGSITTGLKSRIYTLQKELELTDDAIKKQKELARQQTITADLISEIIVDPLEVTDSTKASFERQKKAIDTLAKHFVDAYATAEQKVAEELAKFDLVANLTVNGKLIFSEDEQRRIREQINDALTVTEIDPKEFGPLERTKSLLDGIKTLADEMEEYQKQAARNIQDAWAEFFFDPFEDGLKGLLNSFIDTIKRMYANQLAAQLASNFSSSGNGLFSFFGGLFGGGRASGGPVSAGQTYLVGEKGPEFFTPGTSGNIVGAGTGGMSFQINNYISADSGPDADQWIPLLNENNRKLKGEILDEIDRGKYNG